MSARFQGLFLKLPRWEGLAQWERERRTGNGRSSRRLLTTDSFWLEFFCFHQDALHPTGCRCKTSLRLNVLLCLLSPSQSHILTLISVAARIFKHASIKNYINLVVVKVLIIDDNKLGPTSSRNGVVLLDNFCAWQRSLNQRSDRHPEHYDTAVLLTRKV